jgi:hypothetical protein
MEAVKKLVVPVATVLVIYAITKKETQSEVQSFDWDDTAFRDDDNDYGDMQIYADSPYGKTSGPLNIPEQFGEMEYSEKFPPGQLITFMQDSANFKSSKELNALIQEDRYEWRNDSKYEPSITQFSREAIQYLQHDLQTLEDARQNATISANDANYANLTSLYQKQQQFFFFFGRPNEVGGGISTLKEEISFHWNRAKHIIDQSNSRDSVLLGQDKFRTPWARMEALELELREIYIEFNRLGDRYNTINRDIRDVLQENNFQPPGPGFLSKLFSKPDPNERTTTPEKKKTCVSHMLMNLKKCRSKAPVPGAMPSGEVEISDRNIGGQFSQRPLPTLRKKFSPAKKARTYQVVNTPVRSAPVTKRSRAFDVGVRDNIPAMPKKAAPFNQGTQQPKGQSQQQRFGSPIPLNLNPAGPEKDPLDTDSITVTEIEHDLKRGVSQMPVDITKPLFKPISIKVDDVINFTNRINAIAIKARHLADDKPEGYRSDLIALQIELDNLVPIGYNAHTLADAVDDKADIYTRKGEKITQDEALSDPTFLNYRAKLLEVRGFTK